MGLQQVNCEKYKRTEALFTKIWTSLVASADTDHDGKISATEWLLLWETYKRELVEREKGADNFLANFYETSKNPDFRHLKEDGAKLGDVGEWDEVEQRWKPRKMIPVPEDTILPSWLHDYLTYRFDLLDRTGDGEIDSEEFEYVLTEFGIRGKDSRKDVQSLHKVGHNTRCTWGSNSLRVESRSWVLHYVAWALSCCSARLPSSLLHTCPPAHRQYYLKLVFFCRQFVGNLDKAKLKLESHYLPSC